MKAAIEAPDAPFIPFVVVGASADADVLIGGCDEDEDELIIVIYVILCHWMKLVGILTLNECKMMRRIHTIHQRWHPPLQHLTIRLHLIVVVNVELNYLHPIISSLMNLHRHQTYDPSPIKGMSDQQDPSVLRIF